MYFDKEVVICGKCFFNVAKQYKVQKVQATIFQITWQQNIC